MKKIFELNNFITFKISCTKVHKILWPTENICGRTNLTNADLEDCFFIVVVVSGNSYSKLNKPFASLYFF